MRRLATAGLLTALLSFAAAPSFAADASTPAATPTAQAVATPLDKAPFMPIHGKGVCTVNLPSLAASATPGLIPTVAKVTCAAPGTQVGDIILTSGMLAFDTGGATSYASLWLAGCVVRNAGTLDCAFRYLNGVALDPAPVSFNYIAVQL